MKNVFYLFSLLWLCVACSDKGEALPAGPARPTMNVQDSLAIVAYYHSMKCAEWKGDFHWDLTDYETWGGVTAMLDTVKNEYRITGIEVPMAETYLPAGYCLPAELGKLSELRSLIVWGDGRAEGGIPSELFNCPLEMMYIKGKGFTKKSIPENVLQHTFYIYPLVDKAETCRLNPDLFGNWENVDRINFSLKENGEVRGCVTAPWSNNGCSSILPETFRKGIQKEAAWSMLFHTFKESDLLERTSYMCFYNTPASQLKVFYWHDEPSKVCRGPQWFAFVTENKKLRLLHCVEKGDDILLFSNPFWDKMIPGGWDGFIIQVPRPAIVRSNLNIDL